MGSTVLYSKLGVEVGEGGNREAEMAKIVKCRFFRQGRPDQGVAICTEYSTVPDRGVCAGHAVDKFTRIEIP